MQKRNFFVIVTGGLYPDGGCKSTSINISCEFPAEACFWVTEWSRKNFPFWNHIDTLPRMENRKALISIDQSNLTNIKSFRYGK